MGVTIFGDDIGLLASGTRSTDSVVLVVQFVMVCTSSLSKQIPDVYCTEHTEHCTVHGPSAKCGRWEAGALAGTRAHRVGKIVSATPGVLGPGGRSSLCAHLPVMAALREDCSRRRHRFPCISPHNCISLSVNSVVWATGVVVPRWTSSLSIAILFRFHRSHL